MELGDVAEGLVSRCALAVALTDDHCGHWDVGRRVFGNNGSEAVAVPVVHAEGRSDENGVVNLCVGGTGITRGSHQLCRHRMPAFGGRVTDPQTLDFKDPSALDVVGIFPDYASAEKAWRAAAQRTVDDAEMRYVVVELSKLLEPK